MDNSSDNQAGDSEEFSYPEQLRLKAFLRDAEAIIAAERGLTASTRLKLEALAGHRQLSSELWDRAIQELQSMDRENVPLSRYEQAFVEFLDQELTRLQGDVLSLQAQKNVIGLAASKYQIPEPRAEQLIDQRTKLASIERISHADVHAYGQQFIAEQIGSRKELDKTFQFELQERARKIGLTTEQVEQEISRVLAQNRRRSNGGPKTIQWIVGILLFAGITATIATGWRSLGWYPFAENKPMLVAERRSNLDIQPEKLELENFDRDNAKPEWLGSATWELIELVSKQNAAVTKMDLAFADSDPKIRSQAWLRLARLALAGEISSSQASTMVEHSVLKDAADKTSDLSPIETLLCDLFFEEPSSEAVESTLNAMMELITKLSNETTVNIADFERQYRANRLLEKIYHFHPENLALSPLIASRKQDMAERMQRAIGFSPVNLSASQYFENSERGMASDQWNFLLQNSWSHVGEVAFLVQPVTELTKARLTAENLQVLRSRLLHSILEHTPAQWINLQQPIRDAILVSGDHELVVWIDLVRGSKDEQLQEFAATILLARCQLTPVSRRLADMLTSLDGYRLNYRNQALQPLLTRQHKLAQRSRDLLEQLKIDSNRVTPDHIAQLAMLTNLNLMMAQQIHRRTYFRDEDFASIDQTLDQPPIRLREQVSIPSQTRSDNRSPSPTASDIRRKNEALQQLSDLNSVGSNTAQRLKALQELETIANRFDDLIYSDAEILAQYFLSELPEEELLNVQRRIGSFGDWPMVGLAIGDAIAFDPMPHQFSSRSVPMDQALTIARLFFRQEFEIGMGNKPWRPDLQSQINTRVVTQYTLRVVRNEISEPDDWDRLKIFLSEIYRQQLRLLMEQNQTEMTTDQLQSPFALLLTTIREWSSRSMLPVEQVQRLERVIQFVDHQKGRDLEKTVLAHQMFFEFLTFTQNRLPAPDREKQQQIFHELEISLVRDSVLGYQLYAVQLGLLKLSNLKLKLLVDELVSKR